jgi:hypothetical protein
MNEYLNEETGKWEECIPEPYYHGFISYIYKRCTGWRDEYGRKAMFMGWDA